ncbi:MAG TPA: tRNA (N(6)-L-threonylcarbamoyladenosine(37)-C(2))-methylthiotransferase MtaB [Rhodospirillaceae bacterium]|nr:tRNA (N(6)-L-threonylcarbamoyladenosine(37)-C(2))-methylthiotransferase MtaB [Rhodospirillaceae bacterium]
MPPSVHIITFGCRLNSYESEVMRAHASAAGLGDVVLVNTCAVTSEAERQARQAIRKARREHPTAKIIVTGCAAQIHPERYAALEEVDYVIGNNDKLIAETYTALGANDICVSDIAEAGAAHAPIVEGFEGGLTRGFIQVQNGCDHRCTYCIIPYGRGPSRSVALDVIVDQTQTLLSQGYPEIALTGVDITSYGAELENKMTLGAMIRQLLDRVPELKRLRLSSLDPAAIDEDLWGLLEHEPRLMPHWHLSVQSCDDMVLRRMARRHRGKDLVELCTRARALRPDITFGADLIAGFPSETEKMFENTARLVEELNLTWLHVFPYSVRSGTPAAKMPQVPMDIRRARAAKLREIGERAVAAHLDGLVGQRLAVHVEQPLLARTPTFAPVRLTVPATVGSVINVECLERDGDIVVARGR